MTTLNTIGEELLLPGKCTVKQHCWCMEQWADKLIMQQIHNPKTEGLQFLPKNLQEHGSAMDYRKERILQLATYQFLAARTEAWSIKKDFKSVLNPLDSMEYTEIPAWNWILCNAFAGP